MSNQRILFEYSPAFTILCLALGIAYAWILYRSKHTWSTPVNRTLFVMRAALTASVAFMLLGPILKLVEQFTEKPAFVFLIDNSRSIKEAVDSVHRQGIHQQVHQLGDALGPQGYAISYQNLSGTADQTFNNPTSDLAGAIRTITSDYEGKNLAGIVLLSDGIYNSGSSPLYVPTRIPIYTVGVGDTTQRTDLVLKNLAYNKIAYQGNRFPLRAEVVVQGLPNQDVTISIFQGGKLANRETKNTGTRSLIDFDVQLDAREKGLQRIDVMVEPLPQESNKKNNRASAFIEVVEGKKKILLVASAPHPDIKAIRSVVEKNSNYEFIVHIPGVKEADSEIFQPGKADLVIFHEPTDVQGKLSTLFNRLSKAPASVMVVIGNNSNVRLLNAAGLPLTFESAGQWDEVTPIINPAYRDFVFSENINTSFSRFPPVTVPFGKFRYPANASVLLYQRIGNVDTDRPMAFTYDDNGRKMCVMIGAGFWRWRLNEFSETGRSENFDEVFSKLIQYMSTVDDKRKFRCFPIQNEFSDAEPVIFESQVYNDLFEQVYGHKIDLQVRDEKGKMTPYNYVTSPGSSRYQIGGLKEGVYRYSASTTVEGKREEVRGEFLVVAQNIEAQNLTADFNLLKRLAEGSGGKFYRLDQSTQLQSDLQHLNARGLIHSEESFHPLINLKWVFFLLLLLVSLEWSLRKYLGAY